MPIDPEKAKKFQQGFDQATVAPFTNIMNSLLRKVAPADEAQPTPQPSQEPIRKKKREEDDQ